MTTALGHRYRTARIRGGLALLATMGALIVLGAPPAGAGGWAVTTLDPMTAPVAGVSTRVGFTIRQHGVRPVNPDGRVGLSVEDASGREHLFAVPEGGVLMA